MESRHRFDLDRLLLLLLLVPLVRGVEEPDQGPLKTDPKADAELNDRVRKIIGDQNALEDPMPILLLPGFASSRLRAYARTDCPGNPLNYGLASDVWLDVGKVLSARWCFLHCMGLNPSNQSDPVEPPCRVRPDQGLDAISELSPGLLTGPLSTVWKYLINMLLEMGFIPEKNLLVAPYDFRLAPSQLEERDAYFTRVKLQIEQAVQSDEEVFKKNHPGMSARLVQRGVMIIAHSMGNSIFRYFEAWIKYTMGVTAGRKWLIEYVNTFIAVGAPNLGAQFAIQAAVSGLTFGLPISEYNAREMGLGFSSYGMVLPVNPSRRDERHEKLNNGHSAYPIPVASVIYPNGTQRDYEPSKGVWRSSLWRHLQEFDSWAIYLENFIRDLYSNDPVMDFEASWERPEVQNVYCVYGVNQKTPVSFTFEFPQNNYEHDWDTVNTVYEEANKVYDDHGEVLYHTTQYGRSGDGTVSYFSLSWCHAWMGEKVNITRVPQKDFYGKEDIVILRDVEIDEYVNLENINEGSYDTFFEERQKVNGRFRSTAVWELDKVDHRAVIFEPVFLQQMSHQIHVQNNVVGKMEKQVEKMVGEMISTISIFPVRGTPASPQSDDDCYWDYGNVHCALPEHCGYYYKFGDYHLGMSCRLHTNWAVDNSTSGNAGVVQAAVPCECKGHICYHGICLLKGPCENSFVAPGLNGFWGHCKSDDDNEEMTYIGKDMVKDESVLKMGINAERATESCKAEGTCNL